MAGLASGSLPPKSRASALRGSCRGGGAGFYLPARRGPRTSSIGRAVASRIHCRVRAGPCCRGGTMSAHALVCVRACACGLRRARRAGALVPKACVPWPNRWRDGTWRAARTSMIFFLQVLAYCCARWPDVKASTTRRRRPLASSSTATVLSRQVSTTDTWHESHGLAASCWKITDGQRHFLSRIDI